MKGSSVQDPVGVELMCVYPPPPYALGVHSTSLSHCCAPGGGVWSLSHVWLFATPWTVACQAPLSMEFSGQEYWSGLPFPPPGDLSHPGIEPLSLALAGRFFSSEGVSS